MPLLCVRVVLGHWGAHLPVSVSIAPCGVRGGAGGAGREAENEGAQSRAPLGGIIDVMHASFPADLNAVLSGLLGTYAPKYAEMRAATTTQFISGLGHLD